MKKAQPREVMQSLQGGRGRVGRAMAGRGFCELIHNTVLVYALITMTLSLLFYSADSNFTEVISMKQLLL